MKRILWFVSVSGLGVTYVCADGWVEEIWHYLNHQGEPASKVREKVSGKSFDVVVKERFLDNPESWLLLNHPPPVLAWSGKSVVKTHTAVLPFNTTHTLPG